MSVRYALINPPLTDPTAPYHSISYLVGAAEAAGFHNHSVLDANLLALESVTDEEQICDLLHEAEDFRTTLEQARSANRLDQLRYRSALAGVGLSAKSVTAAIETLRDPQRFYDWNAYEAAMLTLNRLLALMELRGLPAQFSEFGSSTVGGSISYTRSSDLTNPWLLEQIARPFAKFFEGEFRVFLRKGEFQAIGVSVNYVFQLPYAIWMTRMIARECPAALLCVGGTEISDIVKYSSVRVLFKLFADCEVAVLGEGESAFVEILRAVQRRAPLPTFPGIVTRKSLLPGQLGTPRYEDLRTLPAPRYDIWEWNRYWSPEPVLLYSPTRGCYWNRCTFCDYGLNADSPTSPARQRPLELVLADLVAAARVGRTLYFAVDAIPPAYLKKLCAALIEHNVGISWAAEIRMEGGFLKGLADDLRRAGCVALSFGYESGAQRVLQLIDKGQRVDQVPALLRAVSGNGIACQLMGFIGFPTETVDEALQTYRVLEETHAWWVFAAIGDFVLTPGAIVAKQPNRFGITSIGPFEGEDICRWLWWKGSDGVLRYPGDQRNDAGVCEAASRIPFLGKRPYLGGIDTGHSILYFRRFGPDTFKATVQPGQYGIDVYESCLPVADFATLDDLSALHSSWRRRGESAGWAEIDGWLQESLPLSPDQGMFDIGIGPQGDVVDIQSANPRRTFTIVPAG
jgi:anaerobic magnesium-protoporphyrin IX monomethyl ester cyclase